MSSSVFTASASSVGQTVQLLEKVVLDSGLKNLVMVGYLKIYPSYDVDLIYSDIINHCSQIIRAY